MLDVLKIAGLGSPNNNNLIKCPCHERDEHPSCSILERGFNCFSCGAKGGIADFLIKTGNAKDTAEAARVLENFLDAPKSHYGVIENWKAPTSQRKLIEAEYPYTDEAGVELYRVVRYKPKDFRQKRPDGNGGWVWNLTGILRVPFRLAKLLEAIRVGNEPVVVGEGEKDVLAAESLGYVATTSACGAAWTWTEKFVNYFRDAKRIAVFAHADEAGRTAAKQRANLLASVCPDVKIVDFGEKRREGFDLADFIAEGNRRAEVDALVEAAPRFEPLVGESKTPSIAGPELFNKTRRIVTRFVSLGEDEATAVTLWIMMTHALEGFDCAPYLAITSAEKQCGKTRLLEVEELLVAHPWLTGRCTPAVLARKIDAESPTLLLDESDATFNGNREFAETLRGVLNTGHLRSGKVSLCVAKGKEFDLRDFSTFGPKAISGIGSLPDTVADRSIPIRLTRKLPAEHIERFRRKHVEPEACAIRADLEAWAKTFVAEAHPEPKGLDDLPDRAADICEPLLQIAEACSPEIAATAHKALVSLCGFSREDESLGVKLLSDIRTIYLEQGNDQEAVFSASLASKLASLEESVWEPRRGRDFDARRLAGLLKGFTIRPARKTIRIGEEVGRGYHWASFEDAWNRFLPPIAEISVTSVTSVTNPIKSKVSASGASLHSPLQALQFQPEGEPDNETLPVPQTGVKPSCNGQGLLQTPRVLQKKPDEVRNVTHVTDVTLPQERGKARVGEARYFRSSAIKPGPYNGGRLHSIQTQGGRVYRKSEPHPFIAIEGGPGTHCELCRKAFASHGKPPRSQWSFIPAKPPGCAATEDR
jgi:Protein of unknown function (DUF3631)